MIDQGHAVIETGREVIFEREDKKWLLLSQLEALEKANEVHANMTETQKDKRGQKGGRHCHREETVGNSSRCQGEDDISQEREIQVYGGSVVLSVVWKSDPREKTVQIHCKLSRCVKWLK